MYSQYFKGKVHLERHGKKYHFSWLEVGENRKFTWEQARNYCRRFCMDAISIQSVAEYNTVKEQLRKSEYQGYRNNYNLIVKDFAWMLSPSNLWPSTTQSRNILEKVRKMSSSLDHPVSKIEH